MIYLYRHAEKERQEVHDGEAREQLGLQEHGGVVMVAALHCGVVVMGNAHLVVHNNHVDHHAHHRHAEDQTHKEGLPPP